MRKFIINIIGIFASLILMYGIFYCIDKIYNQFTSEMKVFNVNYDAAIKKLADDSDIAIKICKKENPGARGYHLKFDSKSPVFATCIYYIRQEGYWEYDEQHINIYTFDIYDYQKKGKKK